MEYYKFTKRERKEWLNSLTPVRKGGVKMSTSRKDTTYYAVNQVGIKPFVWQKTLWDLLDSGKKRISVCSSRQVGKSLALALFALKAIDLNIFPSGVANKTHVGIISATEEQSKKLMLEIQRLIRIGDDNVMSVTNGKVINYFSNKIDKGQAATNNKTTITFTNGNSITCLPPTDRVRGYSFSYVFVDEAAFLENDDIFFDSIEPTVSRTNGTIVLTSTPNGQRGFYFDIFDPEDIREVHDYTRLWIHYEEVLEGELKEQIDIKRDLYYQTGREKHFEQEYDALFTAQVSSFFESEDVDKVFSDTTLYKRVSYSGECDCSIDFGMVNSHTVVTVSMLTKQDTIIRLYHHQYPYGEDDNLIKDLTLLKERFNIQRFIPDDCPQGYHTIQKMKEIGWNVKPMSFRRDKVGTYNEFRAWTRQGKIFSYKDRSLEVEMKALQEEDTPRSTAIHKPSGGTDDLIDAFVMSSKYFIAVNKGGVRGIDWDDY
ncbi:hypothetical protein CMI37_23235 [Candidatus Pacearchaeota archaeon]|nr:hypothetical protein [Candidatus Pacearchaeota archaeon]|tara:strand:+ start:2724 stop:4178 length:1455 start_codon:yes stop_codon:yes gene_type:complete